MSLYGQASGNSLKGKINRLTELRGYSAYEIALIHGFVGTEEEWINSITGGGGVRTFNGREGYIMPQAGDYTAAMVGADQAGAAAAVSASLTPRIEANTKQINANTQQIDTKQPEILTTSISLPADKWTESDVGYTQPVTIEGGNENTLVSLQPSAGQMYLMMEDKVAAIMVNNLNGAFVASAVGAAPTTDMTIQATLTEVSE